MQVQFLGSEDPLEKEMATHSSILASRIPWMGNLINWRQGWTIDEGSLFNCFPGSSDGKESACNAGDLGLISGSGRSSGKVHDNPLQYSWSENSMDRGAQWATVHGATRSWT